MNLRLLSKIIICQFRSWRPSAPRSQKEKKKPNRNRVKYTLAAWVRSSITHPSNTFDIGGLLGLVV